MVNVEYTKELSDNPTGIVSLGILTQKQLKDTIVFLANKILEKEKSIIIISFSNNAQDLLTRINKRKNLVIIDAFSRENKEDDNSISIPNPGDLTGIQIAIERAEKKITGEKIIIFDSINALSIYVPIETIGKFFHMYNNKVRLSEEGAILFTIKESTDTKLLELMKEFADKVYDYADMFATTLSLAEEEK